MSETKASVKRVRPLPCDCCGRKGLILCRGKDKVNRCPQCAGERR